MAQTVYQLTGDALDGDIHGDIHFNGNYYYLGISIEQKEFMKYPPEGSGNGPFSFTLNGKTIQMGRTYMYEPGVPLYAPTLRFEKGHEGVIVQVVELGG